MRLLLLILIVIGYSIPPNAQKDYLQYNLLSYNEIDSFFTVFKKKGAYAEGLPYVKAGREKAALEFGRQDSTYASYCTREGRCYELIGDFAKAESLYLEVQEIYRAVYGEESQKYGSALNNLGLLYFYMGAYDEALPLYLKAKQIIEEKLGAEDAELAGTLCNLGFLYQKMGYYNKALPLYLQAKYIDKQVYGTSHPYFAESLNNIGLLYEDMGEYEKALPLLQQAKNIIKETAGPEHFQYATALVNLSRLYSAMGNLNEAVSLLLKAIAIDEKTLGSEHPELAISLHNLAALHCKMANYDKALPLYMRVKRIDEKRLGKKHPQYARLLHSLADLYMKMGLSKKALSHYHSMINLREQIVGGNHPNLAMSYVDLARAYQKLDRYEEAKLYLLRAMEAVSCREVSWAINSEWATNLLQAPYPSIKHSEVMISALEMTYLLLQKDTTIRHIKEKKREVANLALDLLSLQHQKVSGDKDKVRILGLSSVWVERNLSILNSKKDAALALKIADKNKSVLLYQSTKSEQAYRIGNLSDSLVYKNKKLLKQQAQLQAQLYEKGSRDLKDSLRAILNEVNQEIDIWAGMVRKDYPKYYQYKYQEINPSIDEIQAALDHQTALIEYVVTDSILHIFRVDKKRVCWHKESLKRSLLKLRIAEFHRILSDYNRANKNEKRDFMNYVKSASWFYQKLLQPVLNEDDAIQNLIIITDGDLGHLPYESFLVEATQSGTYQELHYLLRDYNISYSYSATLWQENKKVVRRNNNGQLFGAAAYYPNQEENDYPSTVSRWSRFGLFSLPAAKKEVKALEQKYRGFFVFDSLATEKTIIEQAENYAVIHLALHGLLNKQRPMLSALAFTADGDSIYDNFWQAHEISKMELKADLVVLSACETGYGKFESGNGIASLARSFMYAGVPSMVVSLWQVNDVSTSVIMQNFYKYLAEGKSKSAALRQAKLEYINSAKGNTQHPAFWSPFIMMGKTEPVSIKKKGSMPWGILGGLALLGLGLGGLVIVRRRKKELD